MNEPKVSVLIPLYNRKHYIEDCVNSVLNQTFKDFDIIIRDDCSTDGAFELVKKKYSKEISAGKVKLLRNDKNLSETFTVRQLIQDARGKYITVLHCDDMYLSQSLEILFNVAEKYSADVVHSTNFLISSNDGVIKKSIPLKKISKDRHNIDKATIFSIDSLERFNEWFNGGTFQDLQYNIFRRDFITANKDFFFKACCDSMLFTLIWMLQAKTYVKIPDITYIRRDAPDSQTNDKNSALYKFENSIPLKLELFRSVDKFISECAFLKDNAKLCYLAKTKIFITHENLNNVENNLYGNTNYVNLYGTIENAFRKYFGADAVYLALLFHWAHLMHFNKNKVTIMLKDSLNVLLREI